MLRQRIRCDAPSLSLADYDFIMQCRNDRPRSKVLNELKEKYSISQKRIYQIWRGEEKNRVAWDQPIYSFNSLFSCEPSSDLSQESGENLSNKDQENSKKENSFDLKSQKILPLDFVEEGRDLNTFYKKEAIRDKKNIAKYLHILAK